MTCHSKLGNQDHEAVTHDSRHWIVIPSTVSETALFVFHATSLRLIDSRPVLASISVYRQPRRSHQPLLNQDFNTLDIHGTPGADRLSRSETNHVPGFIDALAYAVNPTVAQRMVDRFRPGYARLATPRLKVTNPKLCRSSGMLFQPSAEISTGTEKRCLHGS